MILSSELKDYLINNRDKLINRDFLIDTFLPKRDKQDALMEVWDTFTLEKGDIENYNGTPIKTTVGRYMVNYIVLVYPFNDNIAYVNTLFNMGDIERKVAEGMINEIITVEQFNKFLDNAYFIGHFTELGVPTLTDKSLGTHPDIKKVKAQLIEKYKDSLTDPKTIEHIEGVLLEMDKEYLDGDESTIFYDAMGSKMYNINRKKMYLTVGGIEAFDESNSEYVFLENSLNEGWDRKDFKVICDELRKGSYSRGAETAKAGDQTKFVLRIFNNIVVEEADCGTKRGLLVTLTESEIKNYIGRTAIIGGKETVITFDNQSQFINKPIKLRSPMYCQSKTGLCYRCCGAIYEKLGVEAIGMEMISVSSAMMMVMMKNFHGTKVTFKEIDPLEYFG